MPTAEDAEPRRQLLSDEARQTLAWIDALVDT